MWLYSVQDFNNHHKSRNDTLSNRGSTDSHVDYEWPAPAACTKQPYSCYKMAEAGTRCILAAWFCCFQRGADGHPGELKHLHTKINNFSRVRRVALIRYTSKRFCPKAIIFHFRIYAVVIMPQSSTAYLKMNLKRVRFKETQSKVNGNLKRQQHVSYVITTTFDVAFLALIG